MKRTDKTADREKTRALLKLLKEAKQIRLQLLIAALMSIAILFCVLAAPKLLGDLVQQLIDYFPIRNTAGYSVVEAMLPGLCLLTAVYLIRAGRGHPQRCPRGEGRPRSGN